MVYIICRSSLGGVVVSSLRSEAEGLGSIPGEVENNIRHQTKIKIQKCATKIGRTTKMHFRAFANPPLGRKVFLGGVHFGLKLALL